MRQRACFISVLVVGLLPLHVLRAQEAPGEGVWTNFDFVPGDTVLFVEDFSGAYVGDFPADRLEFIDGSMEVVERDGNRMLRTLNEGTFRVLLPETLPDRFTVEFDVEGTDARHTLYLWTEDNAYFNPGSAKSLYAVVHPQGSGLSVGKYAQGPKAIVETGDVTVAQPASVRISAEGGYLKMYVNEKRVSNVPKAPLPRTGAITFQLGVYPHDDEALYLDNLRIAQGGRQKLYDLLMAEGHVVTQGIYFDVNSATLRPESTPTLRQLEQLLKEHPDVRVRIEGHTDNTGTDEVNQPLSSARAEAVRQWLMEQGIAEHRLQAQGFGASRPLADNDTAENRARNRRTEVWRLDTGN